MVAPIDAKATFEAEGEAFTLRLNFRTLALAAKEGVDMLAGKERSPLEMALVLKSLASVDHPEMTDDTALALMLRHSAAVGAALTTLFEQFGGDVGGNVKPKAAKAKA